MATRLLGVVIGLLAHLAVSTRSGIVDLGYSQYQGTSLPNGIDEFLSMRYAKPALDDLRFRAPQDPEQTDGVIDATEVRIKIRCKFEVKAQLTESRVRSSFRLFVLELVNLELVIQKIVSMSMFGGQIMRQVMLVSLFGCSSQGVDMPI